MIRLHLTPLPHLTGEAGTAATVVANLAIYVVALPVLVAGVLFVFNISRLVAGSTQERFPK